MITIVFLKELRDVISSMKFVISYAVCSILIVLSFYVGARGYQSAQSEYDASRRENLRQMEGLTDWLSVRQHRIYLPPQPLASLVGGIANDIGRTTEVRGRGELDASGSRFGDDPIYAVFRFLDLDFLFGVILSLFAIVFAYDAVCGEKERGTLRLTFANALPRDQFILAKLSGTFAALGLPLLIPFLIGCALVPLLGVQMNGESWLRLALVLLAGYLYLAVFLALSMLVSVLTKRSVDSFLILLVLWVFAVFIIPRASVLVAGRAVSVPSVDEIASQKNRYFSQLWTEDRRKLSTFKATSNADPSKMVQEFSEFMQKISDERDQKMEEFGGRLNEELENRRRIQERWALGFARISPASAFSLAVTTLAGTSMNLKDQYYRAAMEYQRQYADFIKAKTGMVPGGRIMIMLRETGGKTPPPINTSELPVFMFQQEPLRTAIFTVIPDAGLLLFFVMVFFAGAYFSFLRYDLR